MNAASSCPMTREVGAAPAPVGRRVRRRVIGSGARPTRSRALLGTPASAFNDSPHFARPRPPEVRATSVPPFPPPRIGAPHRAIGSHIHALSPRLCDEGVGFPAGGPRRARRASPPPPTCDLSSAPGSARRRRLRVVPGSRRIAGSRHPRVLRTHRPPPPRPRRQPPAQLRAAPPRRHQGPPGPQTAANLARKQADGKTRREALRCLKRRLARRVWRLLRTSGHPLEASHDARDDPLQHPLRQLQLDLVDDQLRQALELVEFVVEAAGSPRRRSRDGGGSCARNSRSRSWRRNPIEPCTADGTSGPRS